MLICEETKEIIKRREKIVADYCISKKWPIVKDLSMDQIFEIRNLQEWKDVPKIIKEENS